MRLLKNTLVAAGLLWVGLSISYGQSLHIDLLQFYKEQAIITYSILGINDTPCSIKIFSSIDNFKAPLNFATGDVGEDVDPGDNKKIVVDIKKEFGDYAGEITFQIVCKPAEYLLVRKSFRRGKLYKLRWGINNNSIKTIRIELLNNAREKVWEAVGVKNSGSYNWKIPRDIKNGDYRLRFTGIENENKTTLTNSFQIKPKIPLLVKVVGGALVGSLVFILIDGQRKTLGSETLPEFSDIGFPDK
jgi:hypothetical protein